MSITLTPAEYAATHTKFAKINTRAASKGFTGHLSVVGERITRTTTDVLTGLEVTEVLYEVTIGGEAPSYGGWTFLARVDAVGDTFTLATAPGVDHVDRSLVRPGHCDHCQANRNRKNTMLVRNDETGEIRNVGSTCIKDFLDWDASVVFFSDADVEREVAGFAGTGEHTYEVHSVLAAAHAATKAFGWVPSSAYDKVSTAHWVRLALGASRPTEVEKQSLPLLREFAAEAGEQATTLATWIASDDFAGVSTYVDNLKASVSARAITAKQISLLASAPNAYARHLETKAEREAREAREALWAAEKDARKAGGFIAEVGQKKVEVEGTISAIRYISGDYGTTTLYTITTTGGDLVKWFSSNGALGEAEGVEVKITGTVKAHEEYQGTKSTVLTRCKPVA